MSNKQTLAPITTPDEYIAVCVELNTSAPGPERRKALKALAQTWKAACESKSDDVDVWKVTCPECGHQWYE